MPTISVKTHDRRLFRSCKLLMQKRQVHSQSGEDGIIEEIFRIIEPRSRWCVDVGAWDGVYLSNTCNLIRNHGWSGVLIEGSEARAAEIKVNHPGDEVIAVSRMVGCGQGSDALDDVLKETPIPREFDLLCVDVDSVDYYIWESANEYRPRVVLIEYNGYVPNDVIFIQDRDGGLNEGCSLAALIELGKSKGYELICCEGANAFFVAAEEFGKFDIADNSIEAMRISPSHFIWPVYNGKLYNTLPRLGWNGKHVPLSRDSLQLLSEFRHAGRVQGESGAPLPTGEEIDLTSAEGILRELFYLRGNKPEDREERNKRAWAAAKQYMTTNWRRLDQDQFDPQA